MECSASVRRFNECHRLSIAAVSPGYPGSGGAGADVRTVPGFGKDMVGRLPMRINQLAGWLRHASQSVLSARCECLRVGKRDIFSVQIRYQPLRRNHGRTQSLSLTFSAPFIAIFRILKLPNLSTHETNSNNLFHQFHAVIIEFIYIVVNYYVDNNIDIYSTDGPFKYASCTNRCPKTRTCSQPACGSHAEWSSCDTIRIVFAHWIWLIPI